MHDVILVSFEGPDRYSFVGGLATRPDLVAEFVKMGARYVSTGTDLGFLVEACSARAKAVKEIRL